MSYRITACSFALGLALLAGCSGSSASVEGSVSVDGAPVDVGTIVFTPEGGVQPVGADIRDGKYSISDDRGLAPGGHKVAITWKKKTGKKTRDTADTGEVTDARVQVLPDKFNKQTELTADLKSGSNPVNFDLKVGKDFGKPLAAGRAGGD